MTMTNLKQMSASQCEQWVQKLSLKQRKKFSPGRQKLIERVEIQALTADIQGGRSDAEKLFKKQAGDDGWDVLRRGWPDFLCVRNSEVAFVEVKGPGDKISAAQRKMLDTLSGLGLKCYVWGPVDGYKDWLEFRDISRGRSKSKCDMSVK